MKTALRRANEAIFMRFLKRESLRRLNVTKNQYSALVLSASLINFAEVRYMINCSLCDATMKTAQGLSGHMRLMHQVNSQRVPVVETSVLREVIKTAKERAELRILEGLANNLEQTSQPKPKSDDFVDFLKRQVKIKSLLKELNEDKIKMKDLFMLAICLKYRN